MADRPPDHRFREHVKDLFAMHASERRGVLLLCMILLALSVWVWYEQWYRTPTQQDLAPLQARLEQWIAQRPELRADTVQPTLFPFDPNTIGRDQWKALGLTDRQVDGIQRYQQKGGTFRTKKDLGRMYSIKGEQFAALAPFILLPDSFVRGGKKERKPYAHKATEQRSATIRERGPYTPFVRMQVELNTADTVALIALPGIGPSFARGIVKYRNRLGGYVSLDQLAEVFVLKDKPEAVLKLKEILILDTLAVRRIPINTCTVEELAAHPYCGWKLAKPLIAYRNQHGPFKIVNDIRGCVVIDEAVFRKLAPYLSVE